MCAKIRRLRRKCRTFNRPTDLPLAACRVTCRRAAIGRRKEIPAKDGPWSYRMAESAARSASADRSLSAIGLNKESRRRDSITLSLSNPVPAAPKRTSRLFEWPRREPSICRRLALGHGMTVRSKLISKPDCPARSEPARLCRIRSSCRHDNLFPQGRLGGGQTGDGNAERAAAYIGQADLVAELDGVRIAAVLAADADFQILALTAALVDADLHQSAHAVDVDRLKWIPGDDLFLGDLLALLILDLGRIDVMPDEAAVVVPAHAKGRLRQVVGA